MRGFFSLCFYILSKEVGECMFQIHSLFGEMKEKKSFFCDLERESKSIRTNGLFLCVQDVVQGEKCVVNFNQTVYT